jgi:hypothetical protein
MTFPTTIWLRFTLILFLYAASPLLRAMADLDADQAFVRQKLLNVTWGQYMAQGCAPVQQPVKGWENFIPIKCQYDSPSGYGEVPVVMLNPDADRLAQWIVTACRDAMIPNVRMCAERMAVQVKCQSNNQFPIAGFVDENNSLFLFRDGVTVSIAGIDTGSQIGLRRSPTAGEIGLALESGSVSTVYKWARIVGTGREDFAAFVGRSPTELKGPPWQDTIRNEYQVAWASNRNRLVSAWAKAHRTELSAGSFQQFFKSACPPRTRWTRWF